MFLVIGVYAIAVFVFIMHVLAMSVSVTETCFIGAVLLAIPLYAQYGNNTWFKLRIFDERHLIFSSDGIRFGDESYPAEGLEAAAVYLDSFDGFMFRDLSFIRSNGSQVIDRTTDGDNNKISVRYKGDLEDFTFYLENYSKYTIFQAVLNDWSALGVNVVVKNTFSDEYILREMDHYHLSRDIH